jgi:hypothetical protein
MPITKEQRTEIRRAFEDVDIAEAKLEAANRRLETLLSLRNHASPTDSGLQINIRMGRGKTPDPKSLTQRVLAEITKSPGPVAISALAAHLNVTPKQARNAVVYHQKKGTVAHAGLPAHFTLSSRLNGSGAHAEN